MERRLLEELLKMFMDSESFYYSLTYDLTNSVQRQHSGEEAPRPLWQKVPLPAQSRVCPLEQFMGLFGFHRKTQHVSELFILYFFRLMTDFFGINIWCKILLRLVWVVVPKISWGSHSCQEMFLSCIKINWNIIFSLLEWESLCWENQGIIFKAVHCSPVQPQACLFSRFPYGTRNLRLWN